MTSIAKGDRVSYTVLYGGTPGNPQRRTEFGRVTRIRPGGPRNEPRATIAVETPAYPRAARYVERYVADIAPAPAYDHADRFEIAPGHNFTDRELLNIARLGLSRIYTGQDSEASDGMREAARQALARLEGMTSIPGPPADHTGDVRAFLAASLYRPRAVRDTMTLDEIAAEVTRIATGTRAYIRITDDVPETWAAEYDPVTGEYLRDLEDSRYCARCRVPEHDTCGMVPDCPCCQDTMANLADGA